jgi:hypothetical protein
MNFTHDILKGLNLASFVSYYVMKIAGFDDHD